MSGRNLLPSSPEHSVDLTPFLMKDICYCEKTEQSCQACFNKLKLLLGAVVQLQFHYISSGGRMIDELETIWKEACLA